MERRYENVKRSKRIKIDIMKGNIIKNLYIVDNNRVYQHLQPSKNTTYTKQIKNQAAIVQLGKTPLQSILPL
jgi:hypothetical protein